MFIYGKNEYFYPVTVNFHLTLAFELDLDRPLK